MASWMVHLRIADKLLEHFKCLSPTEFTIGNMAPDSGVPNDDWSAFSPPTAVSHFKVHSNKANPDAFAAKYWTKELQNCYSKQEYSFFLGYLPHLLTDIAWVDHIYAPSKIKFADLRATDPDKFVWLLKEDWYDLDFKYLRDNPDFKAFQIYKAANGFINTFMDEFSPSAFDNRRIYITNWYLEGKDNLDREYPYLSEREMDAFVEQTSCTILDILHTKYGINL